MSSSSHPFPAHADRLPAHRHLRVAWFFVALVPVAFAAAMLVGEGLLTAFGYDVEDTVPFGVVVISAGPALLIMLGPTVPAAWYGLKARREGLRTGIIPVVVAVVVAVAVVGTNVGGYLLARLVG